MTIELPNSYVYPDDFGTPAGIQKSGVTIPPSQLSYAAEQQRDRAYLEGGWQSIWQNKFRTYNYYKPPVIDFLYMGDLEACFIADKAQYQNPNLSNIDALKKGRGESLRNGTPQIFSDIPFSSGPFVAVRALAHYFYGNGASVNVELNKVGIKPTPEKIPDLKARIDSAGVGESNIEMIVPYYTGQDSRDARYYLGNITLKIVGKVTRLASGPVSFTGTAKAFNDTYDANSSNHRNDWDESATTGLRILEKAMNAKSYEIKFSGEVPIVYSR